MSPTPLIRTSYPRTIKLILSLSSLAVKQATGLFPNTKDVLATHYFAKRDEKFDPHKTQDIVFACLIPVLVLGSGLFAGLTLGLMSLDETQLAVLSMSGTPQQREYANKIKPIRKNGHLLLVTLLLSNMILNESLPVISDPVLGGGVVSVVVSTVLIVIFAEIIPQSIFTRHGLYLGAKLAPLTQGLIYFMFVIAWPVSKLLEFALGPHHGIIYRRAELKELINMHASVQLHGGDLNKDTVAIIGATLDLEDKIVTHAMTPIASAFMVSIDSVLDYDLLSKIVHSGHSRVPVYTEVEVPVQSDKKERTRPYKKIVGILLVKQCVLLDPQDATPVRNLKLNKVPFVPKNESLLGLLDKFQEGRSHMAIVSRFSVEKAKSVKKAAKQGLSQRLRARIGIAESESDSSESGNENEAEEQSDGNGKHTRRHRRKKSKKSKTEEVPGDVEMQTSTPKASQDIGTSTATTFREQDMPADAVMTKEGVDEFLQSFDPSVAPLGIITLEDVVEELIGEEIWDEFDKEGAQGESYLQQTESITASAPTTAPFPPVAAAMRKFSFLRPRSAPPVAHPALKGTNVKAAASGSSNALVPATADQSSPPPVIAMPKPVRSSSLSKGLRVPFISADTPTKLDTASSEGSEGASRPGTAKFKPNKLGNVDEHEPIASSTIPTEEHMPKPKEDIKTDATLE